MGVKKVLKSFIEISGPDGTVTVPCFSCAHCQRVVAVPKPDQEGGFCLKCMHHTCVQCGGTERCVPFEKKVEDYEKRCHARQRLLASVG